MANRGGLIWVDAQGERVLHVLTYSGALGPLITALEGASNGQVVENWAGVIGSNPTAPVVATYPTVRMTAQLNYVDGSGSRATVFLPAPVSSIFLGDGITVDPANILVGIINAAVIGNVLAGSGSPVVSFTGGQLIATRFSGIATI